MKYLTNLTRPYIYLHAALFVSAVMLSVIIIIQSTLIGQIIDDVLKQQYIIKSLVIATLFILLSRSVLQSIVKWLGAKLSERIKAHLRTAQLTERRPLGQLLNITTEGIEGIDSFYADYLPQLYRSTLIPLAILLFLFFFHRNTSLIMLITAPFIPIFYIIIGINTSKKASEQMTALNQFSNYFLNAVKGIVTIKLFHYERKVSDDVAVRSQSFKEKTMIILKTAFLSTLMLEFISMLSIGIIALEIGLGLIVFHHISFYTAIVTLMLAPEFYNALKDLGMAFHTGKQSEGYAAMLEPKESFQLKREYSKQQDITLDFTVDYQYFKFRGHGNIPIRELVIFGPSGAGKSTFAKVLAGLETAGAGTVSLPVELENNIAYMSQQPFLLSDTIWNNVTMFNTHTKEDVIKAAERVNMYDVICSLPDGFNTQVGLGGEQLSGGETHRLMLMRMLLNPAKVLIFDEPTAMLDEDTARIVKEAIAVLKQQSIVMTIAHQKSTIQSAPYLILIEDGKITEQGSPYEMTSQFYKVVTHE